MSATNPNTAIQNLAKLSSYISSDGNSFTIPGNLKVASIETPSISVNGKEVLLKNKKYSIYGKYGVFQHWGDKEHENRFVAYPKETDMPNILHNITGKRHYTFVISDEKL